MSLSIAKYCKYTDIVMGSRYDLFSSNVNSSSGGLSATRVCFAVFISSLLYVMSFQLIEFTISKQ